MRTFAIALALVAPSALAFPTFVNDDALEEHMRAARQLLSRQDALGISKAETNCGPTPCTVFNAKDQLVSVTGEHVYQSLAASDIRGPCPGLNAAANHGYLPRNGFDMTSYLHTASY